MILTKMRMHNYSLYSALGDKLLMHITQWELKITGPNDGDPNIGVEPQEFLGLLHLPVTRALSLMSPS